jgi:maltooligosyltrehalose trehalohydrolase
MIQDIVIRQRTIGVNFNQTGKATITVWAPEAERVAITFDGKKLELQKQELGYWQLQTTDITPDTKYKIVLNGKTELPDPASLLQPEGVHGPSKAIDISHFSWTDKEWKNIPLQDYILYELHTGTFTPEGTFAAIEQKLDYLKELGINAIEIMPVAQFPGSRNWGYDGVFPFAVQNSYGGPQALQHLINTCHQKGIAVVLDVVYNHLGPEGNYLGAYGPYFTNKYNTPWGNAINFDDAWCDCVRRYFIENALMWFRDFHVDALRLDAVHAIKDFSPTHILQEIKQHVDRLMKETGRTHYLIVELDLNDTRFINSQEEQGYGMDAQWIDEFHHALRVTATEEKTGYYSDFTGIEHLAKAYQDAYVYDGQYSPHRKKKFGIKAKTNEGHQFVVFSQNHDQVGNRLLGERTSRLVSFEMQKLLAGAVLVSPYLPMLFMGEEWAETNPFLYFVSHTDPELAEAVRKGRKEEFAAFHLQGEAPDPMAEETFLQSKLQWPLLDAEPHKTLWLYYKALMELRRQIPALRELKRKQVKAIPDILQKTLLLHRWHESNQVVCFMNFSKEVQTVTLPSSDERWQKVFDSAEPKWKGLKAAPNTLEANVTVSVQPEAILIYTNNDNNQQ